MSRSRVRRPVKDIILCQTSSDNISTKMGASGYSIVAPNSNNWRKNDLTATTTTKNADLIRQQPKTSYIGTMRNSTLSYQNGEMSIFNKSNGNGNRNSNGNDSNTKLKERDTCYRRNSSGDTSDCEIYAKVANVSKVQKMQNRSGTSSKVAIPKCSNKNSNSRGTKLIDDFEDTTGYLQTESSASKKIRNNSKRTASTSASMNTSSSTSPSESVIDIIDVDDYAQDNRKSSSKKTCLDQVKPLFRIEIKKAYSNGQPLWTGTGTGYLEHHDYPILLIIPPSGRTNALSVYSSEIEIIKYSDSEPFVIYFEKTSGFHVGAGAGGPSHVLLEMDSDHYTDVLMTHESTLRAVCVDSTKDLEDLYRVSGLPFLFKTSAKEDQGENSDGVSARQRVKRKYSNARDEKVVQGKRRSSTKYDNADDDDYADFDKPPPGKVSKSILSPNPSYFGYGGREYNTRSRSSSSSLFFNGNNRDYGGYTISTTKKVNSNFKDILFVYPEDDPHGVSIYPEQVSCLNYGEFLNDSIIEFYLRYLLTEYYGTEGAGGKPKVGYLNSFFYDQLVKAISSMKKGDDENEIIQAHVGKWTKKIDIFDLDFLFIPINQHLHWYLAVICYPGRIINPENEEDEQVILSGAEDEPHTKTFVKDDITTNIGDEEPLTPLDNSKVIEEPPATHYEQVGGGPPANFSTPIVCDKVEVEVQDDSDGHGDDVKSVILDYDIVADDSDVKSCPLNVSDNNDNNDVFDFSNSNSKASLKRTNNVVLKQSTFFSKASSKNDHVGVVVVGDGDGDGGCEKEQKSKGKSLENSLVERYEEEDEKTSLDPPNVVVGSPNILSVSESNSPPPMDVDVERTPISPSLLSTKGNRGGGGYISKAISEIEDSSHLINQNDNQNGNQNGNQNDNQNGNDNDNDDILEGDPESIQNANNKIEYIEQKKCVILLFDSLGIRRQRQGSHLKSYLVSEAVAKKGYNRAKASSTKATQVSCPRQLNSYDCGVYLLKNIEYFLKDPIGTYNKCASNRRDRSIEHWFSPKEVTDLRLGMKLKIQELSDYYNLKKTCAEDASSTSASKSKAKSKAETDQTFQALDDNVTNVVVHSSDCEEIQIVE